MNASKVLRGGTTGENGNERRVYYINFSIIIYPSIHFSSFISFMVNMFRRFVELSRLPL